MKYTPEEAAKILANRVNQPHYIAAIIRKCVADHHVVNAAIEFLQGVEIYGERLRALTEGHEFSADDLDDLDLEKILAEKKLISAVKRFQLKGTRGRGCD